MKMLLVLCFVGAALALPSKLQGPPKYGNPDEWGDYFQGDIRLPMPGLENGLIDEKYRWVGGVVPFVYSPTFNEANKATVQKAMDAYATLTNGCITFVPWTTEDSYISFVDADTGCWSYVGRIGGMQEINYPQWCIDQYGSVQHEMYHALGFYHEQSRTDRDTYVDIQWLNIQVGYENNFQKYDDTKISSFGEEYDYGSVMHYSGKAFSRNGELTIVTTDPAAQNIIGQRVGLSQIDINKLMKMYNCPVLQN